MAVYVAVFLAVVVGLVVAWRSIGAPSAAGQGPLDLGALDAAITESIGLLEAVGPGSDGRAHRARALAASVAERLARAGADQLAAAGAAGELLGAAADDLGWAARIMEGAQYAGNPGQREAVAALLAHARTCLEKIRRSAPPAVVPPPR